MSPIERPPGSRVPPNGFSNPDIQRRAAHKGGEAMKRKAAERRALAKAEKEELRRILGEKNLTELDALGDDKTLKPKERAEIKMFLVEHSLGKATQRNETAGTQRIEVVVSPRMQEAQAAAAPALLEAVPDGRSLTAG